jgi:rare lipoprotein A
MGSLTRGIVLIALSSASFSVNAAKKQAANAKNSHAEKGIAAFYGRSMEGHRTACGSTYVPSEMTTAHRTLPCGTKVRITNTKNGRSVEATVNDWGPTSRKRIVDVSRAVAERLDFVKQGTTTVEVEVVK